MKRFSKVCCGSSGSKGEEPHPLQPSEQASAPQPPELPTDPSGKLPSHLQGLPNFKIVRCLKHDDAFKIKEAGITPDGKMHAIVISFDKQDKTTMTLVIDGYQCFRVDTKWNIRGETWLIIDGLNVNFRWDTHGLFMKFTFRTRMNIDNFGQRSRGGDDYDDESSVGESSVCGDSWDPEFRGAQWEDPDKFYWLQIIGA